MDEPPAHVAVIACPLCGERHTVRANAGRVEVAWGGAAEVLAGRNHREARVWPAGNSRTLGRWAAIISLTAV